MKYISVNIILSVVFLAYMIHIVKNFAEIFIPPTCKDGERCFVSHLLSHPKQDLYVYTSIGKKISNDLMKVLILRDFDYHTASQRNVELQIARKTRNNGTMYLYLALADSRERDWTWDELNSKASIERIPLVVYMLPQAATFNLLNSKPTEPQEEIKNVNPVGHLKSLVSFSILNDPIEFPAKGIPGELVNYMRLSNNGEYLPIVQYNFLKSRMENMIEIKKNTSALNVSLDYAPASVGKMKLLVQISLAFQSLNAMGFNEKNIDDVKGIFADTNLYFLCATVVISSFHLLFDFLAFKNDISFWRAKKSMVGLSVRTVLWRAFSQTLILLYLFDENTSLIILVPSGIASIIELWKVKKMLHINFDWKERKFPRIVFATDKVNKAEMQTRAVDAEAMRYLMYLLYPICIVGAVYSLMYQPHKSWYSWTLNSAVNGVYAFGFLFMLPQLFINYKLKSVAALPWRAFMYKAFNTFIDDVFAFIITMPVAHRVACFRDDIVFIIYLYQRWLYPVDTSRIDDTVSIEQTISETHKKEE